MRNLSASKAPGDSSRRGSAAGITTVANQAHAKYKGLISTPGYCKFSAWRREMEITKQPFSKYILGCIATQNPDRLWLKDQTSGRSETFGDVSAHVASLSAGLVELGFSCGDVCTMWCSNYVEYWLVCLAVWELGGVILPINCLITLEKLTTQLKETGCSLLVCDSFNLEEGLKIKEELDTLKHVLVIGQEGVSDAAVSVSKMLEIKCQPRAAAPKFDWDKAPICLMYTSRNGESQVVKHTNKSLTAQVFSPKGTSNHWFDQNVADCVFCGNWFFHFTGLHSFALSAIHGLTMYFLSEYSDNDMLTALADLAISNAVLYPWQVRMLSLSSNVEMFDLSNLKVVITGGTILGPTISRELLERLPNMRFIRESYGLKETGLLTYTYPRFDKSGTTTKVPDDHLMPVGLPNMWTSFKVIDRQTGQPVSGPDLQGELCVKTCQLLPGYLGQEETKIVDSEGYFHTGDLGYYDKDGIVYFVEQISSLMTFWMYEIAPSVLESRLLSHASVVDAAVVAVPDKENGQIPRGFVVLKAGHEETEENLINFLESRLQDHERLRGGLHYIQHIPRDENWKVMRPILQKFVPPPKGEGDGSLTVCNIPENNVVYSPRTRRAAEAAAQLLNPKDEMMQNKEPEEIFGMRSRSRRGSQENILENDCGKASANNGIGMQVGPIPEIVMDGDTPEGEELSYWLRVSVSTGQLEKEVTQHPGVGEVVVRGVHVPGVGVLPRAYVTLKEGFSVPGEELANWFNSRLEWRYRLRGGVVVADRLPRDPQGELLVNLDKLDKEVVGEHTFCEKEKYSAENISHI